MLFLSLSFIHSLIHFLVINSFSYKRETRREDIPHHCLHNHPKNFHSTLGITKNVVEKNILMTVKERETDKSKKKKIIKPVFEISRHKFDQKNILLFTLTEM